MSHTDEQQLETSINVCCNCLLVKHTEHSSSYKWSEKTAMQARTSESKRKEQRGPPHFAALQNPAFISADILTAPLAFYLTAKIFGASIEGANSSQVRISSQTQHRNVKRCKCWEEQ